jgi:hypothetical protein
MEPFTSIWRNQLSYCLSYFIQLHRIIMIFSLQSRTFNFNFFLYYTEWKALNESRTPKKNSESVSRNKREYHTRRDRIIDHQFITREGERFYPCVLSCCAQEISVDVAAQRWLPFTTTNDRRATPRPYTHHVSISLSIYPSYILYRSQGAEAGAIKERRHRVQLPIDWIASSSCIHMYYIEKEEGKKKPSQTWWTGDTQKITGTDCGRSRDWLFLSISKIKKKD